MSAKTHAQLLADIDDQITLNNNQDITGPVMNGILQTLNDSMINRIDDAGLLGLQNYDETRVYVLSDTVVFGGGLYQCSTGGATGVFNPSHWGEISAAPVPTIQQVMDTGAIMATQVVDITLTASNDTRIIGDANLYLQSANNLNLQSIDTYYTIDNSYTLDITDYFSLYTQLSGDITTGWAIRQHDFADGKEIEMKINLTNGILISDTKNLKGASYAADYSTNFTDRSLIDKAWVTTNYLPFSGGTMVGNINLANSVVLDAVNGGGQLDLRNGADNTIVLSTDAGVQGETSIYMDNTDASFTIKGGGAGLIIEESSISNYELHLHTDGISIQIVDDPTTATLGKNGLLITDTSIAGFSPAAPLVEVVAVLATSGVDITAGVIRSVSLGGVDIIMKTDNTVYANQFAFNSGESFETVLDYTAATQDNIATLQDASGTIAYLSDFQTGYVYSNTNIGFDRSYDADNTTLDEIADVLGTLINDLKTTNILS